MVYRAVLPTFTSSPSTTNVNPLEKEGGFFFLALGVMVIAIEMTDYSPVESSPITMVRHPANPGSMNLPNSPHAVGSLS